MLALPDVTLVAVDTVCHRLTDMAVAECTKRVKFGDVQVYMNRVRANNIYIDEFKSSDDAYEFTLFKLPYNIKTEFVLLIQWDSWIIDEEMWTDEFLVDYIGAPWWYKDNLNVGNSGFCIRSMRLMRYLAEHRDEFPPCHPEDDTLCRKYRPQLGQFKWADNATAQRFAFERVRQSIESRHFGFHGIFNWPFVLNPKELSERMLVARDNGYIKNSNQLSHIDGVASKHWSTLGQ